MCGIFGYVTNGRGLNDAAVLEALARRGPDASGRIRWTFPDAHRQRPCVLLHTRLAIMDLSAAANQPMTSACGTISLVYNGELFNARELRATLEACGQVFRTNCDTEVLLESYRAWGPACLQRLRGMFAFAVLDREQRTLFLARDHFGIKPLYYSRAGDEFCFSSSVAGILASGFRTRWRLSEHGLAWYRAIGSQLAPDTIVKDVFALEPGCAVTWKEGALRHERWFDLHTFAREQEQLSTDDAVAAIREALEDSAARHMIADVPVGIFLSGGIDSTAMTSLAARKQPDSLRTLSVATDGRDLASSDASVAAQTARALGTVHRTLRISYAEFEDSFEDFVPALDVPSKDGLNTYLVSRAAKDHCTVVLSGLGGDEFFAGYPVFRDIYWSTRLPRLARLARSWPNGLTHRLGLEWARSSGKNPSDVMLEKRIVGTITPDMRRRIGRLAPNDLAPLTQTTVFETQQYMANTLLRDTDAVTMHNSLEARVPFVDVEVLRAALSVPLEARVEWRRNKPALQAAVRDVMPVNYRSRPKKGFDLPLDTWTRCYSADHPEEMSEAADVLREFGVDGSGGGPVERRPESSSSLDYPALVLARWCALHSHQLET